MRHSSSSQSRFPFLESSDDGLYIRVRVSPRGGKNELSLTKDSKALKVRLTSPPVDGEANKALVKLLAKSFKIKKSSIEITFGKKSRNKRVKIEGFKVQEIEEKLSKLLEAE